METEPANTHSVRVFLTNGSVLDTEECFGPEDPDPHYTIQDHIDDRDSVWKGIGSLCVHFKYIVGFDCKPIHEVDTSGKIIEFPNPKKGS